MNTLKHLFRLVAIMACIPLIWSCKSDDDETETVTKVLKGVTLYQELNEGGTEKVNMLFEYNLEGQLIKFTEKHEKYEDVYDLTYSGNKATINKDGSYYGDYMLNAEGYATSFYRPNTTAYTYEYSPEGYLVKSIFGEKECSFTYEHGNLTKIDKGASSVQFIPDSKIDNFASASFYQPQYLHISGTVEVKVGFAAGFFGKPSSNLTKTTIATAEGMTWKSELKIEYTYTFDDKGYVVEQLGKSEYTMKDTAGNVKNRENNSSSIAFVYDPL